MRVLTLNLWQEQGPWQERIQHAGPAISKLRPDVICLQEVREKGEEIPNQAETIARALGDEWTCVAEGAQPWGGGVEGLAILSRFAILQSEVAKLPSRADNQRLCLALRLKTNESECWVATTHLAYRPYDGALRQEQVLAIEDFTKKINHDQLSFILAGDFNAIPDADEIRFLKGLSVIDGRSTYWQDAYAAMHPNQVGWTWCKSHPYTEALAHFPRDRRLDYIFVSPQRKSGKSEIFSCEIVFQEPLKEGLYISDHYGLLAELRI